MAVSQRAEIYSASKVSHLRVDPYCADVHALLLKLLNERRYDSLGLAERNEQIRLKLALQARLQVKDGLGEKSIRPPGQYDGSLS